MLEIGTLSIAFLLQTASRPSAVVAGHWRRFAPHSDPIKGQLGRISGILDYQSSTSFFFRHWEEIAISTLFQKKLVYRTSSPRKQRTKILCPRKTESNFGRLVQEKRKDYHKLRFCGNGKVPVRTRFCLDNGQRSNREQTRRVFPRAGRTDRPRLWLRQHRRRLPRSSRGQRIRRCGGG